MNPAAIVEEGKLTGGAGRVPIGRVYDYKESREEQRQRQITNLQNHGRMSNCLK